MAPAPCRTTARPGMRVCKSDRHAPDENPRACRPRRRAEDIIAEAARRQRERDGVRQTIVPADLTVNFAHAGDSMLVDHRSRVGNGIGQDTAQQGFCRIRVHGPSAEHLHPLHEPIPCCNGDPELALDLSRVELTPMGHLDGPLPLAHRNR